MNETINIFENVCNTSLNVCQKSIYEITMQQQKYAFLIGTLFIIGMIIYTAYILLNIYTVDRGFANGRTTADKYWITVTVAYIIFCLIMLFVVIPDILQWMLNPEYRILEILEIV